MMNKQPIVRMDERTKPCTPMRGSRKFSQSGSKLYYFYFFLGGGIDDPNITINGPLSARQRNAISLADRRWPNIECWHVSFVIFQGIRTNIAKKTNNLVIFRGWGGVRTPVPPMDPPMYTYVTYAEAGAQK